MMRKCHGIKRILNLNFTEATEFLSFTFFSLNIVYVCEIRKISESIYNTHRKSCMFYVEDGVTSSHS